MSREKFIAAINKSYTTSLPSIYLGAGILDGEILADAKVHLPLRMMNRHGLITGATGSGKTRTQSGSIGRYHALFWRPRNLAVFKGTELRKAQPV